MTFTELFDHLGDLWVDGWMAILAGTVALFVLGFLWYGPIFGKLWARAHGVEYGQSASGMGGPIVLTVVYYFAFNIGVSYLSPSSDVEAAATWALVVAVLLIGPALMASVAWLKRKPMTWLLDAAHWVVAAGIAYYVQGLIL